jgi:cytochrome c
MRIALQLISVAVFVTCAVNAEEGPSLTRGKVLFESKTLGTNGKSCATCHPGGKDLEWAATYDEAKLAKLTNNCIVNALGGKELDPASADMKSMILYLKSFTGPSAGPRS